MLGHGLTAFGAILAAIVALTSGTAVARPLDDVMKSGFLEVFVYDDYPPYAFEDEDGLTGIDVEIGRALADGLGVDVRFLVRPADENIDDDLRVNIWKGDLVGRHAADVMMHVPQDRGLQAMSADGLERRNELVHFCCGYFLESYAVIVDPAVIRTESFAPFVHRKIGVEIDTAADFFLSGAFRGQLQPNIVRSLTFTKAAESFLAGEVAALMASRAQTEWVATRATAPVRLMQPPMPGIVRKDWPIGLAVRIDSRDLAYALGDVITAMQADGRMEAIFARYGVSYLPIPVND